MSAKCRGGGKGGGSIHVRGESEQKTQNEAKMLHISGGGGGELKKLDVVKKSRSRRQILAIGLKKEKKLGEGREERKEVVEFLDLTINGSRRGQSFAGEGEKTRGGTRQVRRMLVEVGRKAGGRVFRSKFEWRRGGGTRGEKEVGLEN